MKEYLEFAKKLAIEAEKIALEVILIDGEMLTN